jgi:hypothetical protein
MKLMCNQKVYPSASELWLEKNKVKTITPLICLEDFEKVVSGGVVNQAVLVRLNNKLADATVKEFSRGYALAVQHLQD